MSASQEQDKALLIKQQSELQMARAMENFNALDLLCRSAAWKWYCSEVLAPAVNEARDAALDVESKNSSQRETAAQQYAFGVKLLGLLEEKRAFWAGKAGVKIMTNGG